jgi:hypothetical protein
MAAARVDHGRLGAEAQFTLLFAVILRLIAFGLLRFSFAYGRLVDGPSIGDVVVLLRRFQFLRAFLFRLSLLNLIFVERVCFEEEFKFL